MTRNIIKKTVNNKNLIILYVFFLNFSLLKKLFFIYLKKLYICHVSILYKKEIYLKK